MHIYKMESYCLKFKGHTENIGPKFLLVVMAGHWYYQSVQYVVVKNLDLLKKQKAKGLLSKLGIRTPWSKVPISGDILF